MATVIKIFEGLRFQFQNGVGGVTQRYGVKDLDPATYGDPMDMLDQAVGATEVSYTDPHPTLAGVYAADFNAWPWINRNASTSKTAAIVEITFRTPSFIPFGGVKAELSGSNSQYVLNRWPNGPQKGQPILVGWNPDLTLDFPDQNDAALVQEHILSKNTNGDKFDTVSIPIESPNAILILTRTEFTSPKKWYPNRLKLNKTPFLGFDPGTVLLRDIKGSNQVGVGTYIPTYWTNSFIFEIVDDPIKWKEVAFFLDEHTGKPIEGINLAASPGNGVNNGWAVIQKYGDPVDFSILKFDPNILNYGLPGF